MRISGWVVDWIGVRMSIFGFMILLLVVFVYFLFIWDIFVFGFVVMVIIVGGFMWLYFW